MRYMDLAGYTHETRRYRYKYNGFYEKLKSINRGRMTVTMVPI